LSKKLSPNKWIREFSAKMLKREKDGDEDEDKREEYEDAGEEEEGE